MSDSSQFCLQSTLKKNFKEVPWKLIAIASAFPVLYFTLSELSGGMFISFTNSFLKIMGGYANSFALTFMISFSVDLCISYLQKKLPWNKVPLKRFLIEILLVSVVATIIMLIWLLFWYLFLDLPEEYESPRFLFIGISTGIVMTIILSSMSEGHYFFMEWKNSLLREQKLEKENIRAQYEALKHQMNPHFLFNSLNVLSSVVEKDVKTAQIFIDEFARVYRYILDISKENLVTVEKEMDIVNSFIYLQKIRFTHGFEIEIKVDKSVMNKFIPPLAIQTTVENALKHNIVSKEQPLYLNITGLENQIMVRNNYQPRIMSPSESGIGHKNIMEKYSLLKSEKSPNFHKENGHYLAILPVFNSTDML